MGEGRYISEDIKREVRKRCGFGCVICGFPIYEYDHMLEWSIVRRHVADEITLLCPQHHSEKTKGLLPKKMLEEKNKNPYNILNCKSSPYILKYSGNDAEVLVGNNAFSVSEVLNHNIEFYPIVIDNFPIITVRIEDGRLSLNVFIYDDSNNLVLLIGENELVFAPLPHESFRVVYYIHKSKLLKTKCI